MNSSRAARPGRFVAVALTAALALAGCGGSEHTGDSADGLKVSIISSQASVPGLPLWVAKEQGFFEDHGIQADFLTGVTSGPAIMSALVSGSANVVTQSTAAAAAAFQAGSSVVELAPATRGVAYNLIVSKKLADVPVATEGEDGWQATVKALKGKVIAASGAGSAFDQVLKALFVNAGLSANDFSNLAIAHGGPEVAALKSGQADVVMADFGNTQNLLDQAGGRVVMTLTEQGPTEIQNMAWSGFYTSGAFLKKHPDLERKFQAVVADTRKFMSDPANRQKVHDIAVGAAKIPADTRGLDEAIAQTVALMVPTFKTSDVQATLDFLQKYGTLKNSPAVKPSDIIIGSALS